MDHQDTQAAAAPSRPLLIGWKERVDFPEWKLRRVKIKIDTGARTSALDVVGYELLETAEGMIAEVRLALRRKAPGHVRIVRAPVLDQVVVGHPNGLREQRPVIETTIRLGRVTKRVRVTLTNRATMLFRMILGRKALEGDFVVDVSKKYLLSD
jgi:hypothetical protein